MTNNDVIRSIKQTLAIDESTLVHIFNLSNQKINSAVITGFLKDENDPEYMECDNSKMVMFLEGLITYRRGRNEFGSAKTDTSDFQLTRNRVLKKLRIAFDLKEYDLIELMMLADFEVTKNEISAVFRKEGHKHFRACSDNFLKAFMTGLTRRKWDH